MDVGTMRSPLAIAACLALAVVTMTGEASAQGQSGSESSARLLVFNQDATAQPNGGLRILRGSAAPPRAAAAPQQDQLLGAGRWQAVAGERFWMFDRETGKLASCRNRGTANVGERAIECTFGTLSRYGRTFGNNFTH
jgi:hypothetical protein